MACRMLTTKYISIADVSQFDRYIIDFCKGIERLYGSSVVTPNMHMHCHLSQCVLDALITLYGCLVLRDIMVILGVCQIIVEPLKCS